jgi:Flp pilus assembly protein TadB
MVAFRIVAGETRNQLAECFRLVCREDRVEQLDIVGGQIVRRFGDVVKKFV